MPWTRQIGAACLVSLVPFACNGLDEPSSEPVDSISAAAYHVKCEQVEPTDILISELFLFSLMENYSLTRLGVDESGNVVGEDMPDLVAGQVELVNAVPEAKADLVEALGEIAGEPAYDVSSVTRVDEALACNDLEVWSATGNTFIDTEVFEVAVTPETWEAWDTVHKEIGKVCPLAHRQGVNKDYVDPAGDGSTNLPQSSTVSTTGVRANAFGLCPTGTATGTYCKLSYATGVNWTGRWCQTYYGQLRCLLK